MEEEYLKRFGHLPSCKASCTHPHAACKTTTHPTYSPTRLSAARSTTLPAAALPAGTNTARPSSLTYSANMDFRPYSHSFERKFNTSFTAPSNPPVLVTSHPSVTEAVPRMQTASSGQGMSIKATFHPSATQAVPRVQTASTGQGMAFKEPKSASDGMSIKKPKSTSAGMPISQRNPSTFNISMAMPGAALSTIKYSSDELKDIGTTCKTGPPSQSLLHNMLKYEDSRQSRDESLFSHKVISLALEDPKDDQEAHLQDHPSHPTLTANPIQLQQPAPLFTSYLPPSSASAKVFIPQSTTPHIEPPPWPESVLGPAPGPDPLPSMPRNPAHIAVTPAIGPLWFPYLGPMPKIPRRPDPLKSELERLQNMHRTHEARFFALQRTTTNLFATLALEGDDTSAFAAELRPLVSENARFQPAEPSPNVLEAEIQLEMLVIETIAMQQKAEFASVLPSSAMKTVIIQVHNALLSQKRHWITAWQTLATKRAEQAARYHALEARVSALEKQFTSPESLRMWALYKKSFGVEIEVNTWPATNTPVLMPALPHLDDVEGGGKGEGGQRERLFKAPSRSFSGGEEKVKKKGRGR